MIRNLLKAFLFITIVIPSQAQTYLSLSDSLFDDRFGTGFKDYKDGNNNSGPRKVIEYGNYTIVCGQFDNAFGTLVENIALYDKITKRWHSLGSGLNAAANDMIIYKGELIAVGEFTTAGNVKADRIAKFNFQTQKWSRISSYVFYNSLLKVAIYKDSLVASSNYDNNLGLFETYLLSDTTWKYMVGTASPVTKLLVANNKLYLAGAFNSATSFNYKKNISSSILNGSKLIAYENGTWSSLNIVAAGLATTAKLFALESDAAGNLYTGGDFNTFNGATYMGVLKYDGTSWSTLNGTFAGSGAISTAVVNELGFFNNKLFVGGIIPKLTVNSVTTDASNLMVYENDGWKTAVANLGLIATGNIKSISSDNDTISVVGTFTIGAITNMLQVTKSGIGIKAGGGLNIGGVLNNIEVLGDDVFFNCTDLAHDPIGQKTTRLAKLNLVTGIWDTTFRLKPEMATEATFLTQVNGRIYTAGKKTGTTSTKYGIYIWSDKTHSFEQFGNYDFIYPLQGITQVNNKLITTSGGFLYQLEGSTWSNSSGLTMNLALSAYSPTAKKAYFTGFTNTGYIGIYSFDGTTINQELYFGNGNVVKALHADKNGFIYVGGKFTYYTSDGANNILKYDPVKLTVTAMGGGVNVGTFGTYVSSITSIGDTIFAAGEIGGTYDIINGSLAGNKSVVAYLPSGKWASISPTLYSGDLKTYKVIAAYKKGLVGNLSQYMPLNATSSTYSRSSEGFWDWNISPGKSFPVIPQIITGNNNVSNFNNFDAAGFRVYPNPSKTHISLESMRSEDLESASWKIFNMEGISVMEGVNESGKPSINIEALHSGLYIMHLSLDNGSLHSLKFIRE